MKVIEIKTEDALNFMIEDYESHKKMGEKITLMDFYLENYEGVLLEIIVSLHEAEKIMFNEIETEKSIKELIDDDVMAVENYGGYLCYVSGFNKEHFMKLLNEQVNGEHSNEKTTDI